MKNQPTPLSRRRFLTPEQLLDRFQSDPDQRLQIAVFVGEIIDVRFRFPRACRRRCRERRSGAGLRAPGRRRRGGRFRRRSAVGPLPVNACTVPEPAECERQDDQNSAQKGIHASVPRRRSSFDRRLYTNVRARVGC